MATRATGATVWFTGLPGAGKSTVALALAELLDELGLPSFVLDGDELRAGLNSDLGFSEEDRAENVRRVGEVAIVVARTGQLALVPVISPFAAGRAAIRERHLSSGVPFVEVFVATPLEVCEERDPKGHYAKARTGELREFTGISSPYEIPDHPEVRLETVDRAPGDCAEQVLETLRAGGLLGKLSLRGH